MLVLTTAQMLQARVQRSASCLIRPRLLADGNLAVSERVLTDLAHIAVRDVLEAGTVTATPGAFSARTAEDLGTVDGKTVSLSADDKAWSLQPTSTGHRFELRQGDVGLASDTTTQQRVEMSSAYNTFAAGAEVWQSFTVEINIREWFETVFHPSLKNWGFIAQWHALDTVQTGGRSPVLAFDLGNSALRIVTRSDTDGPASEIERYKSVLPVAAVNFVCRFIMGQSGELQVWRDGVEVVNIECPIGYYNDGTDLGYLQWGIYRLPNALTAAVTTSNMRWGLTDLSDKILNPDPV